MNRKNLERAQIVKNKYQMRSTLLSMALILCAIILLLAASGVVLAYYGPLSPGSGFFPIQDIAEQQFGHVYRKPAKNAEYLLYLVNRRMNDLINRTGSKDEFISMEYLDRAIKQAIVVITDLPQGQSDGLRAQFVAFATQSEAALRGLKHVPVEEPAALIAFQTKLQTIQHMLGAHNDQNPGLALMPVITMGKQKNAMSTANGANSATGLIPFPPGSPGAIHAFYPLVGQHALQACVRCHTSGEYIGTLNRCIYCHISELPISHYPVDCASCHTAVSWADVHFNHTSVASTACSDCHEKDKPSNHYDGPCSACHITENWKTVSFDHEVAGLVDCSACHAQVAPANHYSGQCSNCHNTTNWAEANFNHKGFTNCIGCHSAAAPGGHYSGQCSNCHNTSNWSDAQFNHSEFSDCISCHLKDRPGEHDQGQCSECHNTRRWSDADD